MADRLRFYLDEPLSPVIARQLRIRGVDVVSANEVGRGGLSILDPDQFDFAQENRRVLVTTDRDFISIGQQRVQHYGVMIFVNKPSFGEVVEYLELAAAVLEWEDVRDIVTFA